MRRGSAHRREAEQIEGEGPACSGVGTLSPGLQQCLGVFCLFCAGTRTCQTGCIPAVGLPASRTVRSRECPGVWAGEGAGCPEHPQPGLPCLPRVPREGSSPACASAAVEVETASQASEPASQASDEEDAPATDIYFVSPPGIPPVAGPSTTCAHTCTHTHVPVRTHVCLHPHPFTHTHTAPSQARADTSHAQGACARLHVHSHSGTQAHVPGQHAHTQV